MKLLQVLHFLTDECDKIKRTLKKYQTQLTVIEEGIEQEKKLITELTLIAREKFEQLKNLLQGSVVVVDEYKEHEKNYEAALSELKIRRAVLSELMVNAQQLQKEINECTRQLEEIEILMKQQERELSLAMEGGDVIEFKPRK